MSCGAAHMLLNQSTLAASEHTQEFPTATRFGTVDMLRSVSLHHGKQTAT